MSSDSASRTTDGRSCLAGTSAAQLHASGPDLELRLRRVPSAESQWMMGGADSRCALALDHGSRKDPTMRLYSEDRALGLKARYPHLPCDTRPESTESILLLSLRGDVYHARRSIMLL